MQTGLCDDAKAPAALGRRWL